MVIVGVLFIIPLTVFLFGNHYDMDEDFKNIPTPMGNLSTLITSPKGKEVKGIIIFVHGDGPQNSTQDGGYKPLMERFAKQGFLSVSWDKLGVGKSTGNWLEQTMDDRAQEVDYILSWMKKNYPRESKKIGLWGASQAGWVIPRILNNRKDIDFSIVVAPAINWLRQGEFNTKKLAEKQNYDSESIIKAKKNFIDDSKRIEENDTYSNYKKAGGLEKYSPDRYEFIKKNMHEDSTKYLKHIKSKVFLVLANEDINVDSKETEGIYREQMISKYLEIKKIPNVAHQMINPKIANSEVLTTFVAVMMPKYYLVDNIYLDYCEKIIQMNS